MRVRIFRIGNTDFQAALEDLASNFILFHSQTWPVVTRAESRQKILHCSSKPLNANKIKNRRIYTVISVDCNRDDIYPVLKDVFMIVQIKHC